MMLILYKLLMKHMFPGHRGGIVSCRIWIFLSDPTRFLSGSFRSESGPDFIGIWRNPMKSGSDLVGFHRVPLNSDEMGSGFRSKGIRQKTCRIRSVFYGRCRIPMKSDTDPIENDRIYRSDHLTWDLCWCGFSIIMLKGCFKNNQWKNGFNRLG
jgi:hypothetical protein